MLLGTVLTQTFVGAWIDQTEWKRVAISGSALFVGLACIVMYHFPSTAMIYGFQFSTGVFVSVFPPGLAAISMGLVGRQRLPARAGRNEACFHAGNVVAAVIAIGASRRCGTVGVFYGVAAMAFVSAIAVLRIRETDIDHRIARGLDEEDNEKSVPWSNILTDPRIVRFTLAVVLFHFANAAMLPLVGQKASHRLADHASELMGACIIIAQVTMVPVAILASRWAATARKPIFLVAFAVLPIRGMLFTLTDNPWGLLAIQVLDGIGAGIFGVAALLMMADLTRGTGRFNFAQGLVATSIGLGAALSNFATGRIVDHFGFNAGFCFLAAVAVVAFLLFLLTVRESARATIATSPKSIINC